MSHYVLMVAIDGALRANARHVNLHVFTIWSDLIIRLGQCDTRDPGPVSTKSTVPHSTAFSLTQESSSAH